jgi:pimeloyl-ACP methyl ester carboxylesterase
VTRRALVPLLALALLPLTATPATAASRSHALVLPAPTGAWRVAAHDTYVLDPARPEPVTGGPRALPVRVWYPTAARHGVPVRYVSAAVGQEWVTRLGLPPLALDVATGALRDAPAERPRGVVLLSAGEGMQAAFQGAQVTELASRGWVVVTVDHPHDTFAVEQPGGTVILRDATDGEAEFAARVLDVGAVLRRLPALVPGWRRDLPVAMIGHSIGGAAAAQALLDYPVLRAGVDLDGTPRGTVVGAGLDEPFGIMLSNARDAFPPGADTQLTELQANLRGPHPSRKLDGIGHDGYTDFVVLTPLVALLDPVAGAFLAANFDLDVEDLAEADRALRAQRVFLARFLSRYA